MYTQINFKSKKALKEAVTSGTEVKLFAPGYRDWETDRKSTRLNSSH